MQNIYTKAKIPAVFGKCVFNAVHLLYVPFFSSFFCCCCYRHRLGPKNWPICVKLGSHLQPSVHHKRVKDMDDYGRVGEMIEVSRSTGAWDSDWTYQGGPRGSDQWAPDTILYGGSYLQWWNGGKKRVQSTPYWKEKNEKIQTHVRTQSKKSTQTQRNIATIKHTHTDTNRRTDTKPVSHRLPLGHSDGTKWNPLD